MPLEIKRNVQLGPFTTLRIGGTASYFAEIETEEDLTEALGFAGDKGIEVFILGGGSNVLIADSGFDGLVVKISLNGIRAAAVDEEYVLADAAAGEDWDGFVQYCIENGLAGVECLSGIPGLVGGTPIQNVGAYGQDVAETITEVRCYDLLQQKFVTLSNEECGFSYRQSIFNTTQKGRYIVTSVAFRLRKDGGPKLVYPELIKRLDPGKTTLGNVRNAVLEIRRSKSMVIDEADINSRSAGSFFKNPIVEKTVLERIAGEFSGNVPNFPADEGKVKIPAAWLIENAGFHKGFRHGNAGISANHSLALINLGGAQAEELIELKKMIQNAVNERFGVLLRPEPVFVGFDPT